MTAVRATRSCPVSGRRQGNRFKTMRFTTKNLFDFTGLDALTHVPNIPNADNQCDQVFTGPLQAGKSVLRTCPTRYTSRRIGSIDILLSQSVGRTESFCLAAGSSPGSILGSEAVACSENWWEPRDTCQYRRAPSFRSAKIFALGNDLDDRATA